MARAILFKNFIGNIRLRRKKSQNFFKIRRVSFMLKKATDRAKMFMSPLGKPTVEDIWRSILFTRKTVRR